MTISLPMALVFGLSLLGLGWAWHLVLWVLRQAPGSPATEALALDVREGADAFLHRHDRTVAVVAAALAAATFALHVLLSRRSTIGAWASVSLLLGAACSWAAGRMGAWISIRSSGRVASAARRSSGAALRLGFRAGAVCGLCAVGLNLIGLGIVLLLLRLLEPATTGESLPLLVVGYGLGASVVALLAQLGGGIYTKAAVVGSDLVGKVEQGVPGDDARNPAVVAELVGDNAGDCVGRAGDLFDSAAAGTIGAMILGAALATKSAAIGAPFALGPLGVALFPLVARAFGVLATVLGTTTVGETTGDGALKILDRGHFVTAVLAMAGFGVASRWFLFVPARSGAWLALFLCGLVGIGLALSLAYVTRYYTEADHRPVRLIAEASQTGPATNVLTGLSVALEATLLPALAVGATVLLSWLLGRSAFPRAAGADAGLFGVALAGIGMLSSHGYVAGLNALGGLARNASRLSQLAGEALEVQERTEGLGTLGGTATALTKGYAAGAAALTAFILLSAYCTQLQNSGIPVPALDLRRPELFLPALLGAALVFLFSGLVTRAVESASYYVLAEVRGQLREEPGILSGAERPDFGRAVDAVSAGALRMVTSPALLAIGAPLAVGLFFRPFQAGAEAVAALLATATVVGFLSAIFFEGAGRAWESAKKHIETGAYGGKRSEAHKAAVVGDTLGDPLMGVAGPSLHILVKLLGTAALVFGPLFL